MSKPIDIFGYFDYRDYLADYYAMSKSNDPGFSHRTFLKRAGIPGAMYLQRVITRQRKLSGKYIEHFSRAIGHGSRESRYFGILVPYGNEKNFAFKEKLLKEMMEIRAQNGEHLLLNNQLKFFSRWYYPVVRELVTIVDFRENPALLANSIIPKISPVQAAGAVRYLVKNNFIRKSRDGRYDQIDPIISTGPEVNSTILAAYHRNNLQWCAESLSTIEKSDRDVSSLTLSVTMATYREMKKEIQVFRKKLLAMAGKEKNAEMVCHVGFQLMPRSKGRKKE